MSLLPPTDILKPCMPCHFFLNICISGGTNWNPCNTLYTCDPPANEPLMPSYFFLFFLLVSVLFLLRALPSAVHIVMVRDPKHLPQPQQVLRSSLSHRWYQLVWQLSTWPSSLWALNLTGSNSGCCYRMMSLCMFCVRLAELRLVVKRSRLDPS